MSEELDSIHIDLRAMNDKLDNIVDKVDKGLDEVNKKIDNNTEITNKVLEKVQEHDKEIKQMAKKLEKPSLLDKLKKLFRKK